MAVPEVNALAWRIWDDEFLVYNTASGQTHHLNFSPEKRFAVSRPRPASGSELVRRLAEQSRDRGGQPAIAVDRPFDRRTGRTRTDRAINLMKIGGLTPGSAAAAARRLRPARQNRPVLSFCAPRSRLISRISALPMRISRSAIKTRSAISAFAWHRLPAGGRGVRRGPEF